MNTEKGPYKCLANHRQHTRARLHRGAKIVILQCDVTCLIFSCQAKLNISRKKLASKQDPLTDVMLAFLFTVFVNNLLFTILMYFVLRCTHGNCLEIEIRRIRVYCYNEMK